VRSTSVIIFPGKEAYSCWAPPGNGKTHTIKALIHQLGKPCLYVKSFRARYSTDHQNIHRVFLRARQTTPCLLIMEDLDSLVNNNNRAFFLNELDGFAANTGVMIIATTNHPEKLDTAILDRPSRFDRKYTFALPAPEERTAYLAHWNPTLAEEMRLTAAGLTEIVVLTEGFSFAYLKELLVSAMMQWIATPQAGCMDTAMRCQAGLLSEQIHREATPAPKEASEDDEDED
jgi:AAA+ superfamily predicted ATPase